VRCAKTAKRIDVLFRVEILGDPKRSVSDAGSMTMEMKDSVLPAPRYVCQLLPLMCTQIIAASATTAVANEKTLIYVFIV